MEFEGALAGPSRRDVAGMKAAFGAIEAGEPATVLMRDDRNGSYLLTGVPYFTALHDVVIGGVIVAGKAANERRDDADVAIRKPERDVRQFPAEAPAEMGGEPVAHVDVAHGDLVVAAFEQHPYGRFVIAGVATAASYDEPFVTVGPWILHSGGDDAERCLEITRIAASGEHTLKVPARHQLVLDDGQTAG
ncbi:hypothetical protein [Zhihengliuella salsuginis]|uniref:Uncharacterized protein n=1 Tax=Zhihengliuella salsuginis TaxID=578222 RepID=A0ABQ3GJI5_9MICC|nr:hypothetical protein [Zhihengliuella salsuginis]GHD06331.1 hypothetical protein GCM10008096_16210 [Zhihengliuella salsuginis]